MAGSELAQKTSSALPWLFSHLHHSTATRWGKKVKPRNHTTSCDPTEPDRFLAEVAGDERWEGMKYMTQAKGKASS